MSERGSYAKGRARREEILTTALTLLAEQGYRQTSLRGIGRALGVQPAHILHYFSSKEDLLENIITAWDDSSERHLVADDGSTLSFLEAWPTVVEHNTRVPGLVHLYTAFAAEAADANHPSRTYFLGRFHRVEQRIIDDLEARKAAGTLPADVDSAQAALWLVSFSDGLQLQWLIDPSIDLAAELRLAIARWVESLPA